MYVVYGRRGSGSMAPELVLSELGVPYELKQVEKEDMKTAEYLKINPLGVVPTLKLPSGEIMMESAAMVLYLASAHPSALAPKPGTPEHAKFCQWMVFLSANLYETFLRYFYSDRYTSEGEKGAAVVKKKAEADLHRQFAILENALSPNLLGKSPSFADHYLWMLTTWWDSPSELYARYPRIGALARSIAARPAVAKIVKAHAG
jgi:glutathione S-transferase